jgi:NAD(P)H dehydrogenase (quinone)
MKLLLVYCHPDPNSFVGAVRTTALQALRSAGHEVREIDLYELFEREGFSPVLTRAERASYLANTAANIAALQPHVDALRWAEGLLVVYPTWTYGPPALLKGWIDRVWLPDVAFGLGGSRYRPIVGRLNNIRWFVGITTSGSPWWWLRVVGDPGRRLFMRGLRAVYAPRCRTDWLQLHSMNYTTDGERSRFLQRVAHRLSHRAPA